MHYYPKESAMKALSGWCFWLHFLAGALMWLVFQADIS